MKRIIYLTILLAFFTKSYSQVHTWKCYEATTPNFSATPENQNQAVQSTSAETDIDALNYPDPDSERRYAFLVKFYIIRDDSGYRENFVGEEIVMNVIRDLNINYKNVKIFFKYGGFEYINDTNLVGNKTPQELYSGLPNILNDNSSFNLVILDGEILLQNELVPGYAPFPSNISFYSYRGITTKRIPSHEIGHNFWLKHVASSTENVIRDYQGLGYNANNNGDKIHDTSACLDWSIDQFDSSGYYIGDDIDNNTALPENDINRRYSSQHPKINNLLFLHDGEDLPIGYEFTSGQIKRMRYHIAQSVIYLNPNYPCINALVPLETLYQPFETVLVPGVSVASVSDNGDGTAQVCRNILQKDRFQKGFFTKFIENDNVFLTSTPDDLVEIISPIRTYFTEIQQIDNDHREKIMVPCYRGTICQTESFIGGEVISTQILGSMNLTIKELNEIEVNNPNLYNELMNQYYHILKKYTSSGAVDEKIIYKP